MIPEKAKAAYNSTAVIVFNTLLLFVALNIAIAATFYIRNYFSASDPVSEKYQEARLLQVYPGKSVQEIHALLSETWSRPYAYEAFTQFKERPYRGRYINVDANGFRFSVNQAPWPPDPSALNIFVFGGSTTFGYGVADAETVPSFLQQEFRARTNTPVAVYNFGRGYYYSTQEGVLFEKLIRAGNRPQFAIFIDGLNEFFSPRDRPIFTRRLREFMASGELDRSGWHALRVLITRIPVVRLGREIAPKPECETQDCSTLTAATQKNDSEADARFALNRYWSNKKMIESVAAAHDIVPIFVWQPVPTYNYDQKSHLFAGPGHALSGVGYSMLAAERLENPIAGNFLWCADLQDGRHEPFYVDQVHYTAAFAKDVAACIAKQMVSRSLLRTE